MSCNWVTATDQHCVLFPWKLTVRKNTHKVIAGIWLLRCSVGPRLTLLPPQRRLCFCPCLANWVSAQNRPHSVHGADRSRNFLSLFSLSWLVSMGEINLMQVQIKIRIWQIWIWFNVGLGLFELKGTVGSLQRSEHYLRFHCKIICKSFSLLIRKSIKCPSQFTRAQSDVLILFLLSNPLDKSDSSANGKEKQQILTS